jgi:hypothetical protein
MERTSNVGWSSLVDRMDIEVRKTLGMYYILPLCFIGLVCAQSQRAQQRNVGHGIWKLGAIEFEIGGHDVLGTLALDHISVD